MNYEGERTPNDKFVSRSFVAAAPQDDSGVGWRNILRRQQRGLVGGIYWRTKGVLAEQGIRPYNKHPPAKLVVFHMRA